MVPLLHHPAPHPFTHSETRRRHKLHLTPHTTCYGHQPPHLTQTLPHTCKYKDVIHPSTCYHSLPPSLHTRSSLFIRSTCSQNRIPHLGKLTHQEPSHLLRGTTTVQRRCSLPRNTVFHELDTPCCPLTFVHHQIDIIRLSDMFTYTVKVLEISTSKL